MSVFPKTFLSNNSPKLTRQLTTDDTLNLHVWNKIANKMNEMVEENRLIKQAVLGTYERMKGNYSKLRNKITSHQNNTKDDNNKQMSQSGKKSVQSKSYANTGTNHLPTVTHSDNVICSILKLSPNLATNTNSVFTILEET